uniref:Uncharacterized protein n=1 Tax=Arion vulgaris TaxID=1028688 RepID=A0A0B7BHM5_9EUPU
MICRILDILHQPPVQTLKYVMPFMTSYIYNWLYISNGGVMGIIEALSYWKIYADGFLQITEFKENHLF